MAACDTTVAMQRNIVRTAEAPAAIGPYSQAVVVPVGEQKMVFCSGQIALDPATGQIVAGDVVAQAERVLSNLRAILEEAGSSVADVVKTTVFLSDMADFPRVNEVYAKAFGNARPARSTVQAAGLPRGVFVEIEAIAIVR